MPEKSEVPAPPAGAAKPKPKPKPKAKPPKAGAEAKTEAVKKERVKYDMPGQTRPTPAEVRCDHGRPADRPLAAGLHNSRARAPRSENR